MLEYVTHAILCYITHDYVMLYNRWYVCYITHVMLCYITDMLCYMTHVMLYNTHDMNVIWHMLCYKI